MRGLTGTDGKQNRSGTRFSTTIWSPVSRFCRNESVHHQVKVRFTHQNSLKKIKSSLDNKIRSL